MSFIVKNLHATNSKTFGGMLIPALGSYTIQGSEEEKSFYKDDKFLNALTLPIPEAAVEDTNNPGVDVTGSAAIDLLKKITVDVNSAPLANAFAAPDCRTKRDKTTAIETIVKNSSKDLDYLLTAERYVSGGVLIVENPEFGDYITAYVCDKDGIIPEAYRDLLCENHPVVAEYVEGEWIEMSEAMYVIHEISTKPLNAKVTPGLYLRVTYHTVDVGIDRRVAINYDMTKKL